jgi:glyoxylase-like metal-dependent hydrolase (beta-lactamase superfamily II)
MAKITHNIHSIDGLDILYPGHRVVPYILEEGPHDLTLIDTCYTEELPKLVSYVNNNGYKMQDIRRIILTHLHSDHAQAANEIKKLTMSPADSKSGSSGISGGGGNDDGATIYAHWIDSAFLSHNHIYHGPPDINIYRQLFQKFGIREEDVIKKFKKLDVDPIQVDEQVNDGDFIKSLKVIHTPGHTPGHISLILEDQKLLFGADVLWNSAQEGGLVIPASYFTLDMVNARESVMRVSQLNFDKLLLGHQDEPILENAQEKVQSAMKNMKHRG